MAQKIQWQEPDETSVDIVEINRAATKHGTYTILGTVDATSDGNAKSASNTWTTQYIDTTGTFTNWYKIRFYDSDNLIYSDYSEPITPRQEIKLCEVDEVKKIIDVVGRFTDTEIFDAIIEVEDEIYTESGRPIRCTVSDICKVDSTLQDTYYVGEEDIHRIDRVLYGTTTKHEYFLDDGYKMNRRYGMIRLLSVASGGPSLSEQDEVEIHYVPKIYNRLALYRTCKMLLERVDYATGGATSKQLEVIEKRLENVERLLNQRIGLRFSSDYASYDPVYGVNMVRLAQMPQRNTYISSYGWE